MRALVHAKLEKVVGTDNLRKEILRNVNTMLDSDYTIFGEISPHQIL